MYPNFPTLTKDQIECKVKQVTAKGAVVLLYKTARVDMDMLDSIVGPANWQNSYRDIDGVLYCAISIRDPESKEWIYKEDCGIESRADGEGNEKKGEASDAFKRAGFRWGIGRELYSAPFTFISTETKQNARGNWELADKFEKFSVGHIAYDDDRKISELIIVNSKGNEVFKFPKNFKKTEAKKPAAKPAAPKQEPGPVKSVITGSMEDNSAPWDDKPNPNGDVTQEMRTAIIEDYVKDKDNTVKRKALTAIKKANSGSNDFRNIADPAVRKELYNHFWNLNNELPQ